MKSQTKAWIAVLGCLIVILLLLQIMSFRKPLVFGRQQPNPEIIVTMIYDAALPLFSYAGETYLPGNPLELLFTQACGELPFFYEMATQPQITGSVESQMTKEMIIALEGAEEESSVSLEDLTMAEIAAENGTTMQGADGQSGAEPYGQAGETTDEGTGDGDRTEDGEQGGGTPTNGSENQNEGGTGQEAGSEEVTMAAVQQENAAAMSNGIVLHQSKLMSYDFSIFSSADRLVNEFYIVDPTTSVTEERLNTETLLGTDMTLQTSPQQPQILIYHTHSQEGYADSVPGDESTGVVGAGEYLAQLLRQYGYNVIHHTGEYDVEVRDQAYANAEPAITQLLAENPSIEVVIDLHRDEVREDVKLVTDIDGRNTAKFMLFNGLSYSNTIGNISYLQNPYIKENLAFSFQAQVLANEYYPGVTRRIYLRAYRYNMHFRAKSMLVELGAQTNTREEIWNAVPVLAHVIAMTLRGEAVR